jgi:uncharacterized coiled-coil protein SlyX
VTDSNSSRNSQIQKLEEQVTFLDNHISQQDEEIMVIRKKLDKAIQDLKELRQHFDSGALLNSADQKPPHY